MSSVGRFFSTRCGGRVMKPPSSVPLDALNQNGLRSVRSSAFSHGASWYSGRKLFVELLEQRVRAGIMVAVGVNDDFRAIQVRADELDGTIPKFAVQGLHCGRVLIVGEPGEFRLDGVGHGWQTERAGRASRTRARCSRADWGSEHLATAAIEIADREFVRSAGRIAETVQLLAVRGQRDRRESLADHGGGQLG